MQTIPFTRAVSLAGGEPADETVVGELCLPDGDAPDAVQLLMSGATYGRAFWDFPLAPERHSYVRALTARGHALLNYDRVGCGDSSHPSSERVTTSAHAHVAGQLVDALRAGELGPAFARVIVVAHSYGSVIATLLAAQRPDLDGLVISGLLHHLDTGLGPFNDSLRPAALDTPERFGSLGPGYVTTAAGERGLFYLNGHPEPGVVQRDEALKQTYTDGELGSFVDALAASADVAVPTLVVVGDRDAFFCTDEPCTTPDTGGLALEPASWTSTAPTFTAIPDAPHALTTDRAAPAFFAAVADWCEALPPELSVVR